MKNLTFVVLSIFVAGGSIFLAFSLSQEKIAEAQLGGLAFGGQFTTITQICCDGTYLIELESAENGMPEGTFQTSWSASVYSNLLFFPLPQSCGVGFVIPSGICMTPQSYCESPEIPDYTITMLGTSLPGCSL